MTAPSVATATPAATPLESLIRTRIAQAGGWLPFDDFMHLALYTPGMGYYSGDLPKLGRMPEQGSDFVTAPEMSPLFGECMAEQIAEALLSTGTRDVWEFGAGTGQWALQILKQLSADPRMAALDVRYHIVDVSGTLAVRQMETLGQLAGRVQWHTALPHELHGVLIGNEVLDAMPVKLMQRTSGRWHERGVVCAEDGFDWQDRLCDWQPPAPIEGEHDYLTEAHAQAEAFVRTLAERHKRGAAFFIDYGFPESEYYHPQRHMGTVMCHKAHMADPDPLAEVGRKDITAHVNFTGIALAAQEAGAQVLGYTTQGRFLMNCGALQKMEHLSLQDKALAVKLMLEHEMGELFKVIGWVAADSAATCDQALGFASGDRTHTL
jgi:SAM-dependent MidA family methyltransferase